MEEHAMIKMLVFQPQPLFLGGEGLELEVMSIMMSTCLHTYPHHRAVLRTSGPEIFWILNTQS